MHDDDRMVGRLLTRRELVALVGASAIGGVARPLWGQTPAGAPAPAAACVVQPQQTEGPYFVDEKLLRSDIRPDPATGAVKPGAALALSLAVSQMKADGLCEPLPGAQVDLWQCDAGGLYSDVKDRSFNTVGQKFLRGHQITDKSGAVRFATIYPGWYPGRAVHIHFKIRSTPDAAAAYEFISQFYFDESMTDRVHGREPYASHAGERTRNERDGIFRQGGAQLVLPVVERNGSYEAAFNIAMRPGERPPSGRGGSRGSGR